MAESVTTTFNFKRFDAALAGYVFDLKLDARKVVRTQARLFLQLLLRFVPPKNLAQGRAAVERDLHRVFRDLDTDEWRGFFDENDRLRLLRIDHTGNRRGSSVSDEAIFLKRSEMRAFHLSRLDTRGRVRGTNRDNLIGRKRSDIARYGLVTKRNFNSYLREVQKLVGRAKAGLWPALKAVGGHLPSWVARHAGDGGGTVIDKIDGARYPYIQFSAQSAGLNAVEPRAVQQAADTRTRAMASDIRRIMAGGKSRYFS